MRGLLFACLLVACDENRSDVTGASGPETRSVPTDEGGAPSEQAKGEPAPQTVQVDRFDADRSIWTAANIEQLVPQPASRVVGTPFPLEMTPEIDTALRQLGES